MRQLQLLAIFTTVLSVSYLSGQTIWQRSEPRVPTAMSFGFCESPTGDLWTLDSAGIYVSRDRGATWQWVRHGVGFVIAGQLVADSAGTLYALTEEGTLRSTDNGAHWELSMPQGYDTFGYLTVGPDSLLFLTNINKGVYVSSDHGKNWRYLEGSPAPITNWEQGLAYGKGTLIGIRGINMDTCRFCRSTDRGATWILSEEAFPKGSTFVVSAPGGSFYANTGDTLIVSNDSGRTWQRHGILPTGPDRGLRRAACDREGRIYVGGMLLGNLCGSWMAVSSDAGKTWTVTHLIGNHAYVWYIVPLRGGMVYAGDDGGMYSSADHSMSWQSLSEGITNRRITCFASTVDGKEVYAGTDWGVYCSEDDGMNWSTVTLPLEALASPGGFWVQGLAVNRSDRLFVKLITTNVISTTDRGKTWKGEPTIDTASTCIALDTAQTLLRGGMWGMLDRSSDDGITWAPSGLLFPGSLTDVFVDPCDTLYVSTSWMGLFRVAGGKGADAPIGLQEKNICDFVKHRSGTLIAVTETEGIYRSTSAGKTWEASNAGIPPNFGARSLAMTQGGGILVSGWSGVLMSSDAGASWHSLGEGLPADSVVSVMVTPSGRVIAGTRSGLFYSNTFLGVPGNGSVGLPTTPELNQNYPNPFNPVTTITYSLPHRWHVKLTVYNTLGQHIATLVNGDIEPGYHFVQFNGSNLASGVYFYRLQAGSYTDTKKLLLVK